MQTCKHCRRSSEVVSKAIGYCAGCIRSHFSAVSAAIRKVHAESRRRYGLPVIPPSAPEGISCGLCFHGCRISEDQAGFCGQRRNKGGRLQGGRPHEGNLSFYHDPLPTNCVADFVCPGGTGSGYPAFTDVMGPEIGRKNLAVFYHACSFNCLYCQNYHFKEQTFSRHPLTARELATAVDPETSCICYFGGDPAPQILHAVKASKIARQKTKGRALRICWETNGAVKAKFLKMMTALSLSSGGCIKFDLKAWDERIHLSLCGVSNRQTLENFKTVAESIPLRPQPPLLIASTLMVPGYIDADEVAAIAGFIAGLNPEIPYNLLAFYPRFYMDDLPVTSRAQAMRCKTAAEKEGLRKVHIGNAHLL